MTTAPPYSHFNSATLANTEIIVHARYSAPHTFQNTNQRHFLYLKINILTSLLCTAVSAQATGRILTTSYIPNALDDEE
jgi:hypothetical protein